MPSSCTCSMEVINFFVSMESSVNVILLHLRTVLELEVSVHTECECFAEHLEKQINCMMVLFLHCLLCLLGNDFTSCQWITLASWWNTILLLVSGTTLFFNFDPCAINSVLCMAQKKSSVKTCHYLSCTQISDSSEWHVITVVSTLWASLSGTFLQPLPDLVMPLKGHFLYLHSCPAMQSAPSERFGY